VCQNVHWHFRIEEGSDDSVSQWKYHAHRLSDHGSSERAIHHVFPYGVVLLPATQERYIVAANQDLHTLSILRLLGIWDMPKPVPMIASEKRGTGMFMEEVKTALNMAQEKMGKMEEWNQKIDTEPKEMDFWKEVRSQQKHLPGE